MVLLPCPGWQEWRESTIAGMTATQDQAVNGQAPPADGGEPESSGPNLSERMLGIFGIVFAGVLLGIGLDMLTGGRVGLAAALNAFTARVAGEDGEGEDHG